MLKKKILASNAIYCSIYHDKNLLEKYFDILNELFFKISKFEKNNIDTNKILETNICLSGLREKKI